ncbi:uncharacterized protein BX663DRAFT_415213, partial [Cokeromyces recurvatus]|uniref:uncharacterized protein n=1 Tax=Cokeromyces recurvatus TaxID=90255 RepID=UPI00221F46D8
LRSKPLMNYHHDHLVQLALQLSCLFCTDNTVLISEAFISQSLQNLCESHGFKLG